MKKLLLLAMLLAFGHANISAQSISTLSLAANDGDEGVMFDILAKDNLILTGIDVPLSSDNSPYDIHIYYKLESFESPVTAPFTPGDWTLLTTTGTFLSDPGGSPTSLPLGGATLNLTAGNIYGFYIENVLNSFNLDLNNGIPTGNVAADNAFATIYSGYEINGDGSGNISFSGLDNEDITFLGVLHFSPANAIPTVGEWGLIFLILMLGTVGMGAVTTKRRRLSIKSS